MTIACMDPGIRRDDSHIGVPAIECYMTGMFLDLHQHSLRIVIDDHSRLPGRFFGRFTTSIVGALRSA